jgi:hypothetical protein
MRFMDVSSTAQRRPGAWREYAVSEAQNQVASMYAPE